MANKWGHSRRYVIWSRRLPVMSLNKNANQPTVFLFKVKLLTRLKARSQYFKKYRSITQSSVFRRIPPKFRKSLRKLRLNLFSPTQYHSGIYQVRTTVLSSIMRSSTSTAPLNLEPVAIATTSENPFIETEVKRSMLFSPFSLHHTSARTHKQTYKTEN